MTQKSNLHPNITSKQYQSAKRALLKKEKNNYNRLYFIYCSGNQGWLETAEHSALIYYYEIVNRYGLKNRFFSDETSFYDRYEIGYIRTSNLDDVRHWLEKANLYKGEGRDTQRIFYFELNKIFTNQELDHYLTLEKQHRLEQNSITPARNLSPEFYQLLTNVGGRIYHVCNNQLSRLACDTNGIRIATALTNVIVFYHHLTCYPKNATTRIVNKWTDIYTNLYTLLYEFRALSDLRLVNRETCIGVDEILNRLIDIAKKELRTAKKIAEERKKRYQNSQKEQSNGQN